MTRKANILEYLTGWSGGYYDSNSTDRDVVIRKTVENVLAYFRVAETPENIRNYTRELEELGKDDTIIIKKNIYSHTWVIDVPDSEESE
jgi:hypothetical protein